MFVEREDPNKNPVVKKVGAELRVNQVSCAVDCITVVGSSVEIVDRVAAFNSIMQSWQEHVQCQAGPGITAQAVAVNPADRGCKIHGTWM